MVENLNPVYNDCLLSDGANDTLQVIEPANTSLDAFPAIFDRDYDYDSDVEDYQFYPASDMNPQADQLFSSSNVPDPSSTYPFEISADQTYSPSTNSNHVHVPSTISTTAHAGPNVVILPNMNTDRISLRKFSGYSHEDAAKFLAEFDSYMTLQCPDIHHELSSARRIAAFHMHLSGPAQIWFYSLPSTDKDCWERLLDKFREQYISTDNVYDPSLMVESAAFNKLTLGASQSLEDYHSVILEKGQRLGKLERDMLFKFIEGLPPSLAFFVRAGMATSLKSALISAKSGEAAGYRTNFPGSPPVPKVSAVKPGSTRSTEIDELKDQVQQLRKMMEDHLHFQKGPTKVPRRDNGRSKTTCHRCNGPGHIQRHCLWTGHRTPRPDVQCQVCNQYGHDAQGCMRFAQPPPVVPTTGMFPQTQPYHAASVQMLTQPNQGNYQVPRDMSRGHSGGH